jgi:Fur family transcriptional regulator, stress-responsive regulator
MTPDKYSNEVTPSRITQDVALLRAAGMRVTSPRLAVLAAVRELDHPDVEDVVQAARRRLGSVSTQAVYDVLRLFEDAGLVRRIEPAGSPARYEGRVGDNHHHLVCRRCGVVADVDCVVGHAPCLEPADYAGFKVDEADVTFWGICPACQPAPRRDASPGGGHQR